MRVFSVHKCVSISAPNIHFHECQIVKNRVTKEQIEQQIAGQSIGHHQTLLQ